MAFVRKRGGRWAVLKGDSGEVLSTHATRGEAVERMNALHRENKPKAANRGARAARRNK